MKFRFRRQAYGFALTTLIMLLGVVNLIDSQFNVIQLTWQTGNNHYGLIREYDMFAIGYFRSQNKISGNKFVWRHDAYSNIYPLLYNNDTMQNGSSLIILPGVRYHNYLQRNQDKILFFSIWQPNLIAIFILLWGWTLHCCMSSRPFRFSRLIQDERQSPVTCHVFTFLGRKHRGLKYKLVLSLILMCIGYVNLVHSVYYSWNIGYILKHKGCAVIQADNLLCFLYADISSPRFTGWVGDYSRDKQMQIGNGDRLVTFLPQMYLQSQKEPGASIMCFVVTQYYIAWGFTLLSFYYLLRIGVVRFFKCEYSCKQCGYDLRGTDFQDQDNHRGKLCPECGTFNTQVIDKMGETAGSVSCDHG